MAHSNDTSPSDDFEPARCERCGVSYHPDSTCPACADHDGVVTAQLVDSFSRRLARARFGIGVDMGGRHNPLPSEITAARDMVAEARSALTG